MSGRSAAGGWGGRDDLDAVVLVPRTVTGVLDDAFALLTRRTRDVLIIASVAVVPGAALAALALRDSDIRAVGAGGFGLAGMLASAAAIDGDAVTAVIVAGGLSLLLAQVVTAALTHLVVSELAGEAVSAGPALAVAARRSGALVVAWVAVKLIEGLSALGVGIGVVVGITLCTAVTPAIVAERLGPFAAIRRSFTLVGRRFMAGVAFTLLVVIVDVLVSTTFAFGPALVLEFVGLSSAWWIDAGVGAVSKLVTVPFVSAAALFFYLDLRVRTEGLDLHLQAIDLADRHRPGRPVVP